MTWSFRVSNGDLVLNSDGFATVTNENKLVQDFRHFLLTHMGSDSNNNWYGSVIDGGIQPSGHTIPSVIARTDWQYIKMDIESEIRRVATVYQNLQVERAKNDRQRYNKTTFTTGEVLVAINSVDFKQNADTLFVTINLATARSASVSIDIALPAVVTS